MASFSTAHFVAPEANRPTLPPLRSLCLPDIYTRSNLNIPVMNNDPPNDILPPIPMDIPQRPRQSSNASSCTVSSRSGSPISHSNWSNTMRGPNIGRTIMRHHPYLRPDKCRVLLANSFEKADAMLIFPLPAACYDENNKPIPGKLRNLKPGKAYLVVGKLAVELRSAKNRAMFRAAIYPYRFIPRDLSDSAPPSSATSASSAPPSSATPSPATSITESTGPAATKSIVIDNVIAQTPASAAPAAEVPVSSA